MDFKVDLSNPQEVAAKMPELLKLYETKLREQQLLNEQVELLRRWSATLLPWPVVVSTRPGRNRTR